MSKNGKFLYLVTSKGKFEGYLRFEFIKSSYIFLAAPILLKKNSFKNTKFSGFFTSKTAFGGYFE